MDESYEQMVTEKGLQDSDRMNETFEGMVVRLVYKVFPREITTIEFPEENWFVLTIDNWILNHSTKKWSKAPFIASWHAPPTDHLELQTEIAVNTMLEGYERIVDELTGKKAVWQMFVDTLKRCNQ